MNILVSFLYLQPSVTLGVSELTFLTCSISVLWSIRMTARFDFLTYPQLCYFLFQCTAWGWYSSNEMRLRQTDRQTGRQTDRHIYTTTAYKLEYKWCMTLVYNSKIMHRTRRINTYRNDRLIKCTWMITSRFMNENGAYSWTNQTLTHWPGWWSVQWSEVAPANVMNTNSGAKVQLYSFSTSLLDGVVSFTPRPLCPQAKNHG